MFIGILLNGTGLVGKKKGRRDVPHGDYLIVKEASIELLHTGLQFKKHTGISEETATFLLEGAFSIEKAHIPDDLVLENGHLLRAKLDQSPALCSTLAAAEVPGYSGLKSGQSPLCNKKGFVDMQHAEGKLRALGQ